MKEFKHFTTIAVIFACVLLISNVASTKIVAFWGLTFDAGTLLFPLSYIFGDVLTEVYGYEHCRRVIWLGMAMILMMAGLFYVVGLLPVAEGGVTQEQYMAILGQIPRIVIASIVAYFAGSFSNSYILAKLKVRQKGRFLFVRTIASTLVGEGVDTLLFVMIAFYGILPNEILIAIILSNYIFKVAVEVLFTPATYFIVGRLKKSEGVDIFDRNTNFTPFKF